VREIKPPGNLILDHESLEPVMFDIVQQPTVVLIACSATWTTAQAQGGNGELLWLADRLPFSNLTLQVHCD
jgi:hypothetical protein